jgi:oligoendopeptidase F
VALDFSALPHDFKRRYLPSTLKFEWPDLSGTFDELAARELRSGPDLEKWLLDEGEFDSYIYEQRSIRYINSTRQTDNPEFTKEYEQYTRELEPKIKVASFGLLKKYTSSQFRNRLPKASYGLEDKRREAALSVFRVENVDLEKEDTTLSLEHQRIAGAMTVMFQGEERTLQQMAKFAEETDRAVREDAWRLASQRTLKDKDSLDRIYDNMVALRDRVAKNAGFSNFEEYTFVKKARFDYTPEDCLRFHKAVEEYMVPLSREIDKRREEKLKVGTLRPWDLYVDPDARPPLSPFVDAAGLTQKAAKVIAAVDPQLAGYFERMRELELLDLDSRKGKAPGGYQEELTEARLPFIFMNAARRDLDVRTLLHESGHSFHAFLIRERRLPFFNSGANVPMEFAEVASTSMEIISGEHYEGTFYNVSDAKRSNWDEVVSNVKLFTWVATIDAFQLWVYTHPGHTREERARAWVETFNRFCGLESYDGLESSRAYRWQRQLHLFEVPLYYIEYGIALTGALGVWSRYRKDRRDAVEAYKAALSLGATKPLPDLFAAAGVRWDFGPAALGKFASELRRAIKEYES